MEVRIEHATDRPTLGTQKSLETTVVLICLVGNNEDAEEELKKALEFFRLNTDRRKEAMTLLFLGLASFNLDKYEECKGFCMYDLLQRAEDELDLFITSDQNIRYQQSIVQMIIPEEPARVKSPLRVAAPARVLTENSV